MDSTSSYRRRRFSAEERSRLVSLFRGSGLTQSEFARHQRIRLSTLHHWLYRSEARKKRARFQEVPVTSLLSPWVAELSLNAGLTLRLSSSARAEWIGMLVSVLRQGPC